MRALVALSVVLATVCSVVHSFQPSLVPSHSLLQTRFLEANAVSSPLRMSMKDTYDELCEKVTSTLSLVESDFAETFEAKEWKCDSSGMTGTAAWLDEADPKFLTGVSMCTRVDGDGKSNEKLTINIWMGPSFDVPNLLLTFGEETDGKYMVEADFVPRGAIPLGSDPQYFDTYYGAKMMETWTKAMGQEGVSALMPHPSVAMRLMNSPARIAIGNISSKEEAANIAKAYVDQFLAWLEAPTPVPARSRGSFNLRDDKLRQYFYQGSVEEFVPLLGNELGRTVAAVNTGPTAEAYVGGGS